MAKILMDKTFKQLVEETQNNLEEIIRISKRFNARIRKYRKKWRK